MKLILMDIEGTTSSISFVHKVMFPYSKQRLNNFLTDNKDNPVVVEQLREVAATVRDEDGKEISPEECRDYLHLWIDNDRKHGALKKIQGMIWKGGFESGEMKGHVYPEVPAKMKAWKEAGIELGIYSSGSVEAQKLLFGHSEAGDLTTLLSYYFDTKIGHKREVNSYKNIVAAVAIRPEDILFLSDVVEELDAASEAGLDTIQLVRPDNDTPTGKHPIVENFDQIKL